MLSVEQLRADIEGGAVLALEMEMDREPGYAIASWECGYGDFGLRPDLATLRRNPWLEATALVLDEAVTCDERERMFERG